jgi:taurine transport system substrate-binding protein
MAINRAISGLRMLSAAGMLIAGLGAQQAHAGQGQVIISYWDHAAPIQSTVIATQPSLLKLIPATPKWIPIEASPPAIAAMKSGAFDFLTDVGNPPVTSGIANGADFKVVYLSSVDYVELVVKPGITKPSDLVGKTFSDLVGSSEDYAFRGWLKVNNLLSKVTVIGLTGMETSVAAFKAGRIDGAYVDNAQAQEMIADGGHILTTSTQIAKLGYAGIDVVIVRTPFLKAHPAVVQGYVCAAIAATNLMLSPNRSARDAAFKTAASITGQPVNQAISTGEAQIGTAYIPVKDEWSWFVGADGKVASGSIAKNYAQTVSFLLANGRIKTAISAADIAPHIDPSFVHKALNGGCPK